MWDIGCPTFGIEASNDLVQEPEDAWVGYASCEQSQQYLVVDGGEELFDVALEHPDGCGVAVRPLASEAAEAVHRSMCTLPHTARVRVGCKCLFKKRVEFSV